MSEARELRDYERSLDLMFEARELRDYERYKSKEMYKNHNLRKKHAISRLSFYCWRKQNRHLYV